MKNYSSKRGKIELGKISAQQQKIIEQNIGNRMATMMTTARENVYIQYYTKYFECKLSFYMLCEF